MNLPELKDVVLFIAMNEEGDWVVNSEESEVLNQLAEDQGGYQARVVKITVKMRPPVMAEASVTVPDDAGTAVTLESEGEG